ncbi:hypothetical protein [Helicobacter anatolicus]|uniref:hypothetical protein n=1 Tax=Helicobacter anatolicus TaxID=2905874 RepID=UPI001E36B591|nr:hypothetical protein [Helicobacter anatolicus]MCE3040437.1 hypothetical protein [Helicobacter anatolicus]
MHKPSVSSMQTFLIANGYNASEVEKMSDEELLNNYSKQVMQEIQDFQKGALEDSNIGIFVQMQHNKEIQQKLQEIKERIKKVHQDLRKIYQIVDDFIEDFSIDELRYFLFNGVQKIPSNLIEKALQVKFFQYKIVWLDQIEKNFNQLPEEERRTLMEQYYSIHDSKKLYKIYQNSYDQKEVTKMAEVAKNKLLLLKNFTPEDLEKNYERFYNESEEKIEMIKEIMRLTGSYSRSVLRSMNMEQLSNLIASIRQQIQKTNEEKQIVMKYVRILENSMRSVDDYDFQEVCIDAINHLSNEQLQKVISTLSSQNKFFAGKFESVARQLRSKVKAKIF